MATTRITFNVDIGVLEGEEMGVAFRLPFLVPVLNCPGPHRRTQLFGRNHVFQNRVGVCRRDPLFYHELELYVPA
jgi:hypothetical protein